MIDRVLDHAMVVLVLPQWLVAAAGCIWWVGYHALTGGLS
jgi:hypothetical protein